MSDAAGDLRALLMSRHGLLIAPSRDEFRVLDTVRRAADSIRIPVWLWSSASGLAIPGGPAQMNTADPRQALAFLRDLARPLVGVFLDAAPVLSDPITVRVLKEVSGAGMQGRTIVLTGVGAQVPPGLDGIGVTWRLPPPSREEMREVVERVLQGARTSHLVVDIPDPEPLVDAVMGLSAGEVERVILREAMADGRLDHADTGRIHRARAELLSQESPLDLIDPQADFDDVGGLELLKKWLLVRGRGFEPAARDFGLDPPRGVLLAGVPGCGKSLIARAIAGSWGMALAALDTGRLHGSLVGESEQRLTRALDAAEAMAPLVLWIDEVEKAFGDPAEQDGGVSQRVLSVLLRWLQERPIGVFVVATSNDVTALPPEVTRRGRFDEVFFVDLPGRADRRAILEHHLRRHRRDPAQLDLPVLADATRGFSGAELESVVTSALYQAFAAEADLSTERILAEIAATVPLSRLRAEEISALRRWAAGRARPAGAETEA